MGPIVDRSLVTDATWVLAVKAQIPAETLRRNFPNQTKIGPVEQIRELINVALPGIAIRALPVAPRQLPYYAGTSYFELDRSSAILGGARPFGRRRDPHRWRPAGAGNGMLGDPGMSHGD